MFELHIDALLLGFDPCVRQWPRCARAEMLIRVCVCIYMSLCHCAFVYPAPPDPFGLPCLCECVCVLVTVGRRPACSPVQSQTHRYAESVLSDGIRSSRTALSNYITSESVAAGSTLKVLLTRMVSFELKEPQIVVFLHCAEQQISPGMVASVRRSSAFMTPIE